jgi:hypothetical protein
LNREFDALLVAIAAADAGVWALVLGSKEIKGVSFE